MFLSASGLNFEQSLLIGRVRGSASGAMYLNSCSCCIRNVTPSPLLFAVRRHPESQPMLFMPSLWIQSLLECCAAKDFLCRVSPAMQCTFPRRDALVRGSLAGHFKHQRDKPLCGLDLSTHA